MTLLRDLPRFRYLWLSKAISSTGTGVGLIALVLFVASSGPGAVSLVLIGIALPLLAGPLAGAVADRVNQRRILACCEAGQGVIYAILAVTRPPLPALLPLVILASLLATFGAPAGKSAPPWTTSRWFSSCGGRCTGRRPSTASSRRRSGPGWSPRRWR